MNYFYTLLLLLLCTFNISAQVVTRDSTFVNLGSSVFVGNISGGMVTSPALFIDGDFTNRDTVTPTTTHTGTIELFRGDMEVWGSWFNYSVGHIFTTMFGTSSDGTVILSGTANPQYLTGNTPTHFENLYIENRPKFLLTDENKVRGTLRVNAILELNMRKLIIDNPSPIGIEYIGGYIMSETTPVDGYGELQWNVGATNFGTFNVPFGSGLSNTNDLNLQVNIRQGGMDDNSYLTFATYPTDLYNTPFPVNTAPLTLEPLTVIDRYWIIDPSFQQKPQVDITFTYTLEDLKPTLNTLIDPPNLKAVRFDENSHSWETIPPQGESSPALRTVQIKNVEPTEFFTNWVLASTEAPFADLFIPDAFSPNGDGLNDVFRPVVNENFGIADYELYIFDRFGRKLFSTNDYLEGWDGTISGSNAPIGVYNYLIIVKGKSGKQNRHQGHLTLIR